MADEDPPLGNGEDAPQTRDPEALTVWLADRYRDRLLLFAMRRLRHRAAAEDVVQDALKTVFEALCAGRVRKTSSIAVFAFETARHLCMHRGRSHGRESRALERLAVSPTSHPPDALTSVIDEERARAVRGALDKLDDNDRRLLVMTYVDTRSSEDIGRELGLTAGAVRVRRHRAIQRLSIRLGVTLAPDREQDS